MSVSEFRSVSTPDPPGDEVAEAATSARCDECRAPLDEQQRYCVVCGAHRREVADPAAQYLSQASARARTAARVAQARAAGRTAKRRTLSLGTAALIGLVPVAGVVGYAIGDSGSGGSSPAHASGTGGAGGTNGGSAQSGGGAGKQPAPSTGNSYVQSQKSSPNTVSAP
jgi:hypothetical protein